MAWVGDALMWLEVTTMTCNFDASVEDHDLVVCNENLNGAPHETVRNAVANRVDIDEAIGRDTPTDPPLANRHRNRGKRQQCRPLLSLEAIAWAVERGAVDALICVDEPALEMSLERGEASEREPGNRIFLYVADARLGLAFRASAVRATRSHVDAPVFAECRKGRVHAGGAALAILADNECSSAIDQDLAGHSSERAEGACESLAPIVLPLTQRRAHEDPARVAEHRDEQVHFDASAADHDPLLAEVDLHLMSRCSLETHRRHLGCALRVPMRCECPLQRTQRNLNVLLCEQSLHDYAVSSCRSVEQRHRYVALHSVERPRARSRLRLGVSAAQISLHAIASDAELASDPLGPPAERGEAA